MNSHQSSFNVYLDFAKYTPLKGSSYLDLPDKLKSKKAIINVKNKDQQCLKLALLSALHPVGSNPHRVFKYKQYENEVNFAGVGFPVTLKDIPKVEKQNSLAINVFGYASVIDPLYLTKNLTRDPINLLLITEVKDGKTISNYCWIRDFNRLCCDQNLHHGKTFFCTRCISPHCSERTLSDHLIYCRGVDAPPCHAVFPEVNQETGYIHRTKFRHFENKMKAPYVVYADTESIIEPTASSNTDTNTVQTSEHVPCSFAYVITRSDGLVHSEQLYRGEDAMDVFFQWLEEELVEIREDLKKERPLEMTQLNWDTHHAATKCWICDDPFEDYSDGDTHGLWKVKDHCHITGEYRRAAHSKCNLLLWIEPYHTPIPVFFHNLKNYDSHHLVSAIGRTEVKETVCTKENGEPLTYKDKKGVEKKVTVTDGRITAIVQNMEKLISFRWGQFRFVDSYAFLSSSLVTNTPKEDLSFTRQMFPASQFDLVTRKGVYPYEYMNSFERFAEMDLPAKVCGISY